VRTASARSVPGSKRKTMTRTVRLEQAAAKGPPVTLAWINLPGTPLSSAFPSPSNVRRGRLPIPRRVRRGRLQRSAWARGLPPEKKIRAPRQFGGAEGSARNVDCVSPRCRQKTVDSSRVTEKLQGLGRLEGR
jgi:hypothetical protein